MLTAMKRFSFALLALSTAIVGCAGGGGGGSAPPPVQNRIVNKQSRLPSPIVTHVRVRKNGARRRASVPFTNCNSPYCVDQGDSIDIGWSDPATGGLAWGVDEPAYFTSSFSPNPTNPPNDTTQTIIVDPSTPPGHYAIGVSVTDPTDGNTSGANYFDLSVCDALTGQCPDATPGPSPSPSPCVTPTATPPGGGGGGIHSARRSVQSSRMVRSTDCSTSGSGGSPPPPPPAAKAMYTASLVSHASIPLSDAAPQSLGSLTWNVSGQTTFANVQLAAASTAGPPHTNALTFDVPETVAVGDYPIHLSVTAASGTSTDTIVVLRVLRPTTSESELNVEGVYEEDDQGNIIVPNGSGYTTDDDAQTPDFPFQPPAQSSLGKQRALKSVSGAFNPLAPPQPLSDELNAFASRNKYGCYNTFADDVVDPVANRTSGGSQGTLTVYGYCQIGALFPVVAIMQDGINLNPPLAATSKLFSIPPSPCKSVGAYAHFAVCASSTYLVTPASGHAEKSKFTLTMTYANGWKGGEIRQNSGFFYINNDGVFYPKVPIQSTWALPAVYSKGAGYVPFPAGPFQFCPEGTHSETCTKKNTLRKALLAVLPTPPPRGFEAHHILPLSWCGTNDPSNGVFLPQLFTDPDGDYNAKTHAQFTNWWLPSHFVPQYPLPLC